MTRRTLFLTLAAVNIASGFALEAARYRWLALAVFALAGLNIFIARRSPKGAAR